ncbi:hypothetical protein CBR_g17805 [Chara braunii]|uniref:Uncharacterized protein n=1 Tax=Chara braunii TaxID=69332 RepID=A0A388KVJ9_CHABU|nr:hypothetical protein CBR_g17805 [Chara braunii]|eukprot:GBG74094.1 hypothetical protein CBR_g17805 [Chara braunii]
MSCQRSTSSPSQKNVDLPFPENIVQSVATACIVDYTLLHTSDASWFAFHSPLMSSPYPSFPPLPSSVDVLWTEFCLGKQTGRRDSYVNCRKSWQFIRRCHLVCLQQICLIMRIKRDMTGLD